MKRLLHLFLTVSVCVTMIITSFTFCFAQNSRGLSDVELEELNERGKLGLEYISEHLDEIDAEIAAYQASHPSPNDASYGGFTYKTGDLLITRDTSSHGILGHVGIMMDGQVMEITPKYSNGHPRSVSLADWMAQYSNTLMVVRYTSSSKAKTAAQWGYSTFLAANAPYRNVDYNVLTGILDMEPQYCSKIVWQCYHFGAGVDFKLQYGSGSEAYWGIPNTILPYDFITYRVHNNFSAVYRLGDWSSVVL